MTETHALTLARQIRTKAVSPVAVVHAVIMRIEALQPTVNAFITVTADEAREAGRRAAGATPRVPFPTKDGLSEAAPRCRVLGRHLVGEDRTSPASCGHPR